jgi:hypothetical protein
VIFPVLACGFLVWTGLGRLRRVEYVCGLEGRARPVDALDARSATGYADAQRELIIPERNEASFDWIAQTQQMFAQGELRVRHVDAENAPKGRDVSAASPYRWWLGLVAWLDHEVSGRPIGLSVERAALYSDPLLQLLFLAGAALFTAWQFGGLAAAVLSLGLAAFYPFAAGFLPGMPEARGLSGLLALASVLVLVAGVRSRGRPQAWFALAGVIGGLGMWVSVPTQAPIMIGIVISALVCALTSRATAQEPEPLPWRTWGCSAGATILAAYVAEYFPSDMGSLALASVHPIYGLALVGAGEVLGLAGSPMTGRRAPWTLGRALLAAAAVLAILLLPLALWKAGSRGFLERDLLWPNLSRLPSSPVAAGTLAWLGKDGITLAAWAAFLPLAAVVPALWIVLRPGASPPTKASLWGSSPGGASSALWQSRSWSRLWPARERESGHRVGPCSPWRSLRHSPGPAGSCLRRRPRPSRRARARS